MPNDRHDFEPAIRNSAWWASDTRRAANGRANEVVLEKIGMLEPKDLSEIEAVQMGHIMQPVIGRLASERLKIELKDADYMMTHPRESWLRSHFDFISSDGKTLVEAKNYAAAVRNKFDAEANIVPSADLAQLIHESAVHGISRVVLAVLFGGQEFVTFDFTFSDQQREELIRDMAPLWAAVQAKAPLPPETVEQARLTYKADNGSSAVATAQIERMALALKGLKSNIKTLEAQEAELTVALQNTMRNASELVTVDGSILVTWKSAKGSKKFDAELFKQSMPDLYQQFVREVPGSRRFLVK